MHDFTINNLDSEYSEEIDKDDDYSNELIKEVEKLKKKKYARRI